MKRILHLLSFFLMTFYFLICAQTANNNLQYANGVSVINKDTVPRLIQFSPVLLSTRICFAINPTDKIKRGLSPVHARAINDTVPGGRIVSHGSQTNGMYVLEVSPGSELPCVCARDCQIVPIDENGHITKDTLIQIIRHSENSH